MNWKQKRLCTGSRRWLAPVVVVLATAWLGPVAPLAVRAAGVPPRIGPHDRFSPGERRVYRLSYTNTAESDLSALFAGRAVGGSAASPAAGDRAGRAHVFRTTIDGEWVSTLLDGRGARVRIAAHLRPAAVRFWADGQEALVPARTLRTELSREMILIAGRDGRIASVRFHPATSELSKSYARTLLGLVQWVRPGRPAAEPGQWTAEEEDPNGRYVARYQVGTGAERHQGRKGESGAVQSVRKTKRRYLTPRQPLQAVNQEVHPTVLPAGAWVGRMDRQSGALLSLSGSETAVTLIRGTRVGRSVTGLRLQLVDQGRVGETELAALRAMAARYSPAIGLSAAGSGEADEAAIERRELGDATAESLLAELAKAEAEAARRTGPAPLDTPLYLKLKALIALHPECSRRLGTLLAASNPRGVTAALLTGALSAVGHAPAQAALAAALRHESNDAAATREIAALASVRHPAPLAEATIRSESLHAPTRSLRAAAELGLGTMARNLMDTAPARARRIVDEIVRKLQTARSPEEARLGLMALGNAGSARALPAIARFLGNASPDLRARAAAALRWIDSPQVDLRLAHSLRTDPDAAVRQEAAAALRFREPTAGTVAAQERAFRAERVEGVRLAILSNLARARRAFPQLQEFIRRAAAGDPSANVRKSAAALLAAR